MNKLLAIFGLIGVIAIGIVSVSLFRDDEIKNDQTATVDNSVNESLDANVNESQNTDGSKKPIKNETVVEDEPLQNFKTFTPNEFKELFNELTLPNTSVLSSAPSITGNNEADEHIRGLAEARGYQLRPVVSSMQFISNTYNIQEKAVADYEALKADAAKSGADLSMVSGFRSPADQRVIFMEQLHSITTNYAQISTGKFDSAINRILDFYSVPGYSKHHTGYAIDLQDSGSGLDGFKNTLGYTWMSKNNYENAKKHGFIPSYPSGATNQGPVPEPWEFVWVGADNLLQ